MSDELKFPRQALLNFCAAICTQVRAALSIGIPDEDGRESKRLIDPDFDGWLHGDPSVTKNPTSRYGDRTAGYITGNGLGSMEIGAADD